MVLRIYRPDLYLDQSGARVGRVSRRLDTTKLYILGRCANLAYYQRRGLLRSPDRPPGGVRRYGASDVDRLQFIRRAQAMGFSLVDVEALLDLKGQRACEATRHITEQKLVDVRRRLLELRRLEQGLVELVVACTCVTAGSCCPTLGLLERREALPRRRTHAPSPPALRKAVRS
jgi:MerR family transcriptional regulator, mercuric resistance operon regulatory protein